MAPRKMKNNPEEKKENKKTISRKQQNMKATNSKQVQIFTGPIKLNWDLLYHYDIRKKDFYINDMSRVWFRDHSNINKILDMYIEFKKIDNANKSAYLNTMIRTVISNSRKRLEYPFNEFRFKTKKDEAIGKLLLSKPHILSQQLLNDVMQFFDKNNIKLSLVDLSKNNELGKLSREYIEKKRVKYHPTALSSFYYERSHEVYLEKYYKEKNLLEIYDLDSISLEELCEISTFEKHVREHMKILDIDEKYIEDSMKIRLQHFKDNPEDISNFPRFRTKPKFVLRTNNLDSDQIRAASASIDNFYKFTNAFHCLLENKIYFPSNELDGHDRTKDRKRQFFLDFVRSKDKTLPPFHRLRWNKRYIRRRSSVESDEYEAPPDVQHKNKTQAPNEEPSQVSSSSEVENQTIRPSQGTQKTFSALCQAEPVEFSPIDLEIIKLFFMDKTFIISLKKKLRDEYVGQMTDELWKANKKQVISKLILRALHDHEDELDTFTAMCSTETKAKINAVLNQHEIEAPLASSTQNFDLPSSSVFKRPAPSTQSLRPLQTDMNSLEIITPVDIRLNEKKSSEATAEIKQEPEFCTIQFTQQSTTSDSCVFVPNSDKIVVIESSSEEEDELPTKPLARELDPFQEMLNVSNDRATTLDEIIEPMSTHVTLTKQHPPKENAQVAECSAPKKSKKKHLEFLSNDIESGNVTESEIDLNHELNTNFSISFRPQIMQNCDQVSSEPDAMTFALPTKAMEKHFGRTCFHIELQQVKFQRGSFLEILIDIPQYSLYRVNIKNEKVKDVLNLNHIEWKTLLYNLNCLDTYEYKNGENHRRVDDQFQRQIFQHLDLYFGSLYKFKQFQLHSTDGHNYEIHKYTTISRACDLSDIFEHTLLKQIETFKQSNKIL